MSAPTLLSIPVSVDPFRPVDEWVAHMRFRRLSPRTFTEQPRTILRIARETSTAPTEFTASQLQTWFIEADVAPASLCTYFAAVRAWSLWLVRTGQRADNPTDLLDSPRYPRPNVKPITTEQLYRVLDSDITPSTRAKFILGAYAGLRVSEIAQVRGSDFDLSANLLNVLGKGGVAAAVPLHPAVRELTEHWETQGYWFPSPTRRGHVLGNSVSTVMGNAMKRSGIYGGHPHQLRHWLATELTYLGVPTRVVQVIMRHANLSTTARYIQVADRSQQQAIALIPHHHGGVYRP